MPHQAISMPWGKLAYNDEGTGEAVIFLHSLALSGAMWSPISTSIANCHRVITVDLRGHGNSGWDQRDFTVDDLADDVAALVSRLSIEVVNVVALSMGGTVAISLASRYPDLVRRLVLCDTTAWYGPDAADAWSKREAAALAEDRRSLLPFQLGRWFSASFREREPALVQLVSDIFVRTSASAHAAACRALGAADLRSLLTNITASALVITGAEDYATPADMGRVLAAGIPDAEFRLWPEVRHLSPFESEELRSVIAAHIAIRLLSG